MTDVPLDWESVRQWTVDNQNQIRPLCCQFDFDHTRHSFGPYKPAKASVIKVDIDGVRVVIAPHIDRDGNPAVMVALDAPALIPDAPHRHGSKDK